MLLQPCVAIGPTIRTDRHGYAATASLISESMVTQANFDNLEASLAEARGPIDKSDIVSAIRNMEISRRNAIYGRIEAQADSRREPCASARHEVRPT